MQAHFQKDWVTRKTLLPTCAARIIIKEITGRY